MMAIELSESEKRQKLYFIMKCLETVLFDSDEEYLLMEMGDKVAPDPKWSDYLYKPSRYGLDGSIEAAIEKAFAYQPIILGPPAD